MAGNPRITKGGHDQDRVREIGARLKRARELAGKTQREMSDEMGVAERSVQRWEGGFYELGFTDADDWAQLTGVTLDWLAGRVSGDAPQLPSDALEALLSHARQTQAAIERLISDSETL